MGYKLQYEEPLTLTELQRVEDEAKEKNKGLRLFMIEEACSELLSLIVETKGLPKEIYTASINLLNALSS